MANAVLAIDSRIAGRNPTNALPLFVDYLANAANGVFIRNTNCWAADIDLTCCSPWNSFSGQYRAGTLISPRHVLFAAHFDQIPTNSILKFVDRQNNVIERRLIAKKQHPSYSSATNYPDFCVGLLDSNVPTNQIAFARVLPANYGAYIQEGRCLPSVRLDQEEKATVGDVRSVADLVKSMFRATFDVPAASARAALYEGLVNNDSGNPAFLILAGEPVILTVWTGAGAGIGTSVVALKSDIDSIMADLSIGYQMEEACLFEFTLLGL